MKEHHHHMIAIVSLVAVVAIVAMIVGLQTPASQVPVAAEGQAYKSQALDTQNGEDFEPVEWKVWGECDVGPETIIVDEEWRDVIAIVDDFRVCEDFAYSYSDASEFCISEFRAKALALHRSLKSECEGMHVASCNTDTTCTATFNASADHLQPGASISIDSCIIDGISHRPADDGRWECYMILDVKGSYTGDPGCIGRCV